MTGDGNLNQAEHAAAEARLLTGEINSSFSTRVVLANVLTAPATQNGLLRIVSHNGRGHVGIFCNQYITGAIEDWQGKEGFEALKLLLSVVSGKFSFFAIPEARTYLLQNLAMPIDKLLTWRPKQARDAAPPLAQAVDASIGDVSNVFVSQEWKLEQLNDGLLTTSKLIRGKSFADLDRDFEQED